MKRNYIIFLLLFPSLYCGINSTDIFNGFPKLSKYSVVHPQVTVRRSRSINTPPHSEHMLEDEVSYVLQINKRKHILHLKKNRDFLHPKFVQYSHDVSGSYISSYPDQRVYCYYHGEVEGYENSLVALSTCSGLRGVIYLGNETFALEPVPQSPTNDHILYLLRDVQSEPGTCGVISGDGSMPRYENFDPAQSLTSLLRKRRNLPQTSYVELVLVVDNLRYNFKKQNATAVTDEMVEMANLLDGYYKPLNIRIVLVGLEIFTSDNPFSVEGSAGDVLGRFVKWRKSTLLRKIKHDIGQLIVGRPTSYDGNVLGMAFVGSVCSATTSGGINVFGETNLVLASRVVAHEMGHNLGMKHDDNRCSCDGKSCIMGSAGGSAEFSTCSAGDFERLIIGGGGDCLKNQPSPIDVVGTAECGNGRLDEGEQCDCGKPEECKNKCCDAATCKLASGSACADGDCCGNCQIKVAGTVCRKSVNTCDLSEYCNGKSEFCPDDFYIMDGLPCQNNAAYCFEGRCQTYDYQCRHLFAPDPATKAADICFSHANTLGNTFGNCGKVSEQEYIKCSLTDAMCGKVQCTNVDTNFPPLGAQVSIQMVDGETCVNADFNLGPDVLDPAYVNTGSPCGEGKACLDFHCVNASALLPNLACDAKTTCNGRGVCNDQGNCHCNNGWAPPGCSTAGRGGSVNSGPATIDHSLRNGLLIFFLLVVPVVVAVVMVMLYLFRRDSLDPCLKGGRKSQNSPSRNVQTTQPPVQTSSHNPENPPATTSAPISGYGELDYWNTEVSEVPSRSPAAPAQGPGVPRPIPHKHLDV
ncbi:disintegrin and metalloproteinase domain-containing protein 9 isoform X2 [Gouania willdenowi]|uniref:disintegrin and metalloproteinase domain-containing protein 9 isoform X2 n=1 Tax=Gouania willdenowi TaxID=441366 RepID=UPI001054FD93|nr:disintegrin and metalloproteinase domain-containing protein 9-like isoform X2 [Gouania willdenowi]